MIAIEDLEQLAKLAGAAIRGVYEKNAFVVQTKTDRSPLTEADLLSNQIIIQGLMALANYPYISEEEVPKVYPVVPKRYWLIDPLDGTKEFIARRDSFTVNIALIEEGVPVQAVVYAPMLDELYSGSYGIYRENGLVVSPQRPWAPGKILLASHSHPEAALASFMERNRISEQQRVGSSIKFCWVAAGRAHLYPRFSSLSAWDTAAGDGVARAAGCQVLDWASGKPPLYAYDQARTPGFCVIAPGTTVTP